MTDSNGTTQQQLGTLDPANPLGIQKIQEPTFRVYITESRTTEHYITAPDHASAMQQAAEKARTMPPEVAPFFITDTRSSRVN